MERAFRLAGLLRLRKLQEDQAAARLAAANAALRRTQVRRDGTYASLARHALPDGDHRAWGVAVAGRAALGGLLGEATTAVVGAHERVTLDTSAWSATRSRSVGLEKLEDKHRVIVQHEDDRLEQIVLDEIASRGPRGIQVPSTTGEQR
ncbi:flagellar FliJ family protein [Pengzhenrongella sicca]|uniref:Flagellar FliJ protein n=1 Tax=Pengzhenrongella sicca TaxID=2819238 RepID=A0A8A4ZG01_9MICO|nr:flagellar FliJ family protein [Pengzhenrongella sicca]QTE29873.1 flagellar FliJ family protein [Pengzhenrongella sicca]